MSPHAQLQTAMARTSQPRREAGLLLTLAASGLEPCILPSTPSPKDRVFAGACANASTEPFGTVHPLSAFVAVLDGQRTQRSVCCLVATASFYSHPSGECFHRAPILPYFPCSPSVTRLGAYPAPCGTARLCFYGFQKIFSTKLRTKRGRKDFPNLPQKRRWALGSGAPRVASRKSVPRAIRANTNRRKTWHSTKTT